MDGPPRRDRHSRLREWQFDSTTAAPRRETCWAADPSLPVDAIHALTRARYSPLHLAVIARSPDALQWLLSRGADKGAQNDQGKTAAAIAADNGDQPLVRLLGP